LSSPASAAEGGQHNNTAATDGKQQSNNAQGQRSNDGRMRWRTPAAEEMQWMEKQWQHGNGQATMVGDRVAMMALTTMTAKQQLTNVQRLRQRITMAGKRQWMNNNGTADKQWVSMAKDNGSCLDRMTAEDQLLHGGGGLTMARQRRMNYIGHGGEG
jgi:hypothetical protein